MSPELKSAIGEFAEQVDNKSLLLDKFIFHKSWPQNNNERPNKWDEASRWSFMRIADTKLLDHEHNNKAWQAEGARVSVEKRNSLNNEINIIKKLSTTSTHSKALEELQLKANQRFLMLFSKGDSQRKSIITAQLEGRLLINLSDSLIENAGICLDRNWGSPYIPGSAIKGVARAAATADIKQSKEPNEKAKLEMLRSKIFGQEDDSGAVNFLPAIPLNRAHLSIDITNVHTPEYYKTGQREDIHKEKPIPNTFPCVEVGAQFAFCIELVPSEKDSTLLCQAQKWLERALTEHGLGAKTSAGYGWFSITEHNTLADLQKAAEKERTKKEQEYQKAMETEWAEKAEQQRLASLSSEARDGEILLNLKYEELIKKIDTLSESDIDLAKALAYIFQTDQKLKTEPKTELKAELKNWRGRDKRKPTAACIDQLIQTYPYTQ